MLRTTGIILLAIGFLCLAVAVTILDPTAMDANIGAGGLVYIGRPIGGLGLAIVIVDAALTLWRRRSQTRTADR